MSFVQGATKDPGNTPDSSSYLSNKNSALVSPKSTKGISGFVFDIPDGEDISLQSDITDHYTEDNSYLNDHIVRKPIIVNLAGFIGELVYILPEKATSIQEIANRLSLVSGFLPELTPQSVQVANTAAQVAVSAASAVNQVIGKTKNIIDVFSGPSQEETKQQKAFNALYALWMSQEVLTVLTPWRFFESMAITNIATRQDGQSSEISDITVSLKEIRTSTVKTVNYDQNIDPPRVDVQSGETQDQGPTRGQERNSSFLFDVFGG